jgi:phosphatidylserine decarboxylase
MPATGTLQHMLYVPGRLFSVAPYTVNHIPRLFARNERCICYFETEQGPMAMILVGAINVSAIETVWHGLISSDASRIKPKKIQKFDYSDKNIVLNRGEEMGRFNLGSTVIVLATDQMKIDETIVANTEIKLGQCLALPG